LLDISTKMHAKMSIFAKFAARLIDTIPVDTAVDIRIGGSIVRFQKQIAVERAAGDFTECVYIYPSISVKCPAGNETYAVKRRSFLYRDCGIGNLAVASDAHVWTGRDRAADEISVVRNINAC